MSMDACSITEFYCHNGIPLFPEVHISVNPTNMVDKSNYL